MEASRLALRDILLSVMEEAGEEPHLYYQPPETVKMTYPCIVYRFKGLNHSHANDAPYFETVSFDVTYITRNSDSKVPKILSRQRYSAFDRYYTADNLHHYSYTISSVLKEE